MKRNLIILLILTFFMSCGPYIWFKVPQPKGVENLKIFPEILLGKYSSVADTSIIRIESDRIISEYRENLLMTKAEFREETGDSISTDTSFTFIGNWNINIKSFGDSVKVFSRKDDELFKISDRHILREYKGYYFLNQKDTNDYWGVKVIRLFKDTLEFDFILSDEDIKNIKNITSVETVKDSSEESTSYYLDPTKRELKRILKKRYSGKKFVKLD